MSEPPLPTSSSTQRRPLPTWAKLLLIIGVPLCCIVFCKLVGMTNVETTAFTVLCIFGIGVTYYAR
jgi:hypothetical protein